MNHFQQAVGQMEGDQPALRVERIEFLVPARVSYFYDGQMRQTMVNVNIADNEVFGSDGTRWSPEEARPIMDYLTKLCNPPEHAFTASPEVYEGVEELQQEHTRLVEEQVQQNG